MVLIVSASSWAIAALPWVFAVRFDNTTGKRQDEVARMEKAMDYFGQFQAEADRILGASVPPDT